jgi:hypothetical protein
MTSLNKSGANSPDGNTLSMFEYWKLIESSVYTKQAETGSYDPIKVVTSKEATPISGNLIFKYIRVQDFLLMIFITHI